MKNNIARQLSRILIRLLAFSFCFLHHLDAQWNLNISVKSGFFKTSDSARIHYLHAGEGQAILFVPGWTMPAEIWQQQIDWFSRDYRVIAMDPRSQGNSDKPADGHYPERRAQDIYELVQHLELTPVVLVGWSLAVVEVLTYIDRFGTETIKGFVLVDGYIGDDLGFTRDSSYTSMLRVLHMQRKSFTIELVRGMYRKPQLEEYLKHIVEASLKTPTNTAFTLLAHLTTIDADWRPVLRKVNRPLLYVVTPELRGQAEMVKNRLPSAQVEIFQDAGHALFVDEAERFNATLEKFIRVLK